MKYESADNREQTFLKFWLDSYLCLSFKDTNVPKRPDWILDPLFVGWCRRFIRMRWAAGDISFFYSLQKGAKKCWPQLGEIKEREALADHFKLLSAFHGYTSEPLREMIDFTTRETFKGIQGMHPKKFLPTGSSCLQATRKKGGTLGLVQKFQIPTGTLEAAKIGKLPVLNAQLNAWRYDQYRHVYNRALERLHPDRHGYVPARDVNVQTVPEPSKFRIVTSGDGYLYSALQPIQGLLLDCWKRDPASTMLDDDLTDRVRQIYERTPESWYWCSVDYKGATDRLKCDATLQVAESLKGCPSHDLLRLSLLSGRAKYPEETGYCDITDGQLMGHPTSFPFLCVINKSVYRCAIEQWIDVDRKERLKHRGTLWHNVIVNGDDMLFRCPPSFYPIFKDVARDAGFVLSEGKNYFTQEACMINSQVFQLRNGVMVKRGYLNMKLIKGGGDQTLSTPTGISRDLGRMVTDCPWTACAIPAALRQWKLNFGPMYSPNWYVPVHLGGLGLPLSQAPSTLRITRSQRKLANLFAENPKLALYRHPSVGWETAKFAGALLNWRWDFGVNTASDDFLSERLDPWLVRLCYSARAAHMNLHQTEQAVIARIFRQNRKNRPNAMSLTQMKVFWEAKVSAFRPPPCPPLGILKCPVRAFPL